MYDCDPVKNPGAKLHRRLSFREVMLRDLHVMGESSRVAPARHLTARASRHAVLLLSLFPPCHALPLCSCFSHVLPCAASSGHPLLREQRSQLQSPPLSLETPR